MEIVNCFSIALLLSLKLVAVPGQGFFDYGDLTPSPGPKRCLEGREETNDMFVYRCTNGRLMTIACMIGGEKVPLGRTKTQGSFVEMCKEIGPNQVMIKPVACLDDQGGPPHYPGTSGSTFSQQKNFRFDCVATNNGVQSKPIGCVGDQGHMVKPGTKLVVNGMIGRCIALPDGSISFSSLPDEQPTNPPWQPASEIYPHDGNTPTTMTSAATTTYPTWGNVDLNPTTTTYPSPETASTTTVQTTTMTTETTTQWTPPTTADWVPPTTMQQDPWGQQSTSGRPRGQQTQNPMQTFFGQPGGNGGPSLVVINNM